MSRGVFTPFDASLVRIVALKTEILDRRLERDETAMIGLLAQLVVESFNAGRAPEHRRKLASDSERADAIAEYRAGTATLKEIATRLRRPAATVHRWITKAGARRTA